MFSKRHLKFWLVHGPCPLNIRSIIETPPRLLCAAPGAGKAGSTGDRFSRAGRTAILRPRKHEKWLQRKNTIILIRYTRPSNFSATIATISAKLSYGKVKMVKEKFGIFGCFGCKWLQATFPPALL
jgi:hypothetical protein